SFTVGNTVNADGLSSAVNAFNEATPKTGVSARVNEAGDGLILENASGNDIKLMNDSVTGNDLTVTDAAGGALAGTGTATAANGLGTWTAANALFVPGQVTLHSDNSFRWADAGGRP